MQTAVQLDFQGFEGSAAQRTAIERYLGSIERKFGGIIAGRASVRAPDKHHRHGAAFQVSIHLTLPAGGRLTCRVRRRAMSGMLTLHSRWPTPFGAQNGNF